MFKVYMLSPTNHESIKIEQKNMGRSLGRYLNTTGRWSVFPPKNEQKLIYWNSLEDALSAINKAKHFGRKMDVSLICFSNEKILEKMCLFNEDYLTCLKGYITNK